MQIESMMTTAPHIGAPATRTDPARPGLAKLKTWVVIAGLYPLARLVFLGFTDGLGANPIEFVTRSLGTWTLTLLLITLAVTPLRRLTGWASLMRLRRMLGLFSFFYCLLHLTCYLWLDQFFDWAEILKDVAKRPFITAGMAAFLLLLPLAATSSDAAMRAMRRNWRRLHRLVYVIAVLAVLHYYWLVKLDLTQPLLYAAVLALLLGLRAHWAAQRKRAGQRPARA